MLLDLRLKNIALIDSLELTFQKGLTVLTGETGAGKSILLDALDSVLGGKQSGSGTRLLRSGSDHSEIEASFSVDPVIQAWLKDESFDVEDADHPDSSRMEG